MKFSGSSYQYVPRISHAGLKCGERKMKLGIKDPGIHIAEGSGHLLSTGYLQLEQTLVDLEPLIGEIETMKVLGIDRLCPPSKKEAGFQPITGATLELGFQYGSILAKAQAFPLIGSICQGATGKLYLESIELKLDGSQEAVQQYFLQKGMVRK